jgi:hypothetical protein
MWQPMRPRLANPVLKLLALSLCVLACLPCQTTSQILPTPERTVPVSTEEAQHLVSTLSTGIVPDENGRFVLVITEEELTSYAALNMTESIIDPQIVLTNGQIHLYGTMVSPIEAPVTAVATIDMETGDPRIVVESVSIDGFPVPDTFVQAFAQQIDDSVIAAQRYEDIKISEIDIREGEVVIEGSMSS